MRYFLVAAALALTASCSAQPAPAPLTDTNGIARLFDFSKGLPARTVTMDDPVMGGRSTSRIRAADGRLLFEGHLSLENRGGFASSFIDGPLPDLSAYRTLRLQLTGDGRPYGLSVMSGGVVYRAYFETTGAPQTVLLPLSALRPTRFGDFVAGAPVNPAAIESFGFVINDKKEGDFRLAVASVELLR